MTKLNNKRPTSINFDDELLERTDNYRYSKRLNRSEVVRQALLLLLEKEGF